MYSISSSLSLSLPHCLSRSVYLFSGGLHLNPLDGILIYSTPNAKRQENNSKDPLIFLRAYVLPSPFTIFSQNSSLTDYYTDMSTVGLKEREGGGGEHGGRREREKDRERKREHELREGAAMRESHSFFTDKSASLCLREMEGERDRGRGRGCLPACLPDGRLCLPRHSAPASAPASASASASASPPRLATKGHFSASFPLLLFNEWSLRRSRRAGERKTSPLSLLLCHTGDNGLLQTSKMEGHAR